MLAHHVLHQLRALAPGVSGHCCFLLWAEVPAVPAPSLPGCPRIPGPSPSCPLLRCPPCPPWRLGAVGPGASCGSAAWRRKPMGPESAGGGSPHPCSWTFCPGPRSRGGLGGGGHRHWVPGRDPWGRAVLALAFLGPDGESETAGSAARASLFLLLSRGHRSGYQPSWPAGPACPKAGTPGSLTAERLTPQTVGPGAGEACLTVLFWLCHVSFVTGSTLLPPSLSGFPRLSNGRKDAGAGGRGAAAGRPGPLAAVASWVRPFPPRVPRLQSAPPHPWGGS